MQLVSFPQELPSSPLEELALPSSLQVQALLSFPQGQEVLPSSLPEERVLPFSPRELLSSPPGELALLSFPQEQEVRPSSLPEEQALASSPRELPSSLLGQEQELWELRPIEQTRSFQRPDQGIIELNYLA